MVYRKTEFVERKRQEARERIVGAAVRLLSSHGWRGCGLKAIAKEAGVASGSIYTHFDKIADLHLEVYKMIFEQERAAVVEIAESDRSTTERLIAALDTFTGRALRGRIQAYAMMGSPVPPELETLRQQSRHRLAQPFAEIIREGVEAGEFADVDPATTAACMLGAINESLISPISEQAASQPDSSKALCSNVVSFCLQSVGAVSAARAMRRRTNNKDKTKKATA